MGTGRPGGRGRAVFLDRDGVINRNVLNPASGEYEAPLAAADFVLMPGALDALRQLQRAGFLLFLVSNQPNYAKRKSSLTDLHAIHAELCRHLSEARIEFADFYYCLHHPEGDVPRYSGLCACRKPSPYFLLRAEREFQLDLARSWMIGDRAADVLCGQHAGARTILVSENAATCEEAFPDHAAKDLGEATRFICAHESSPELQLKSLPA